MGEIFNYINSLSLIDILTFCVLMVLVILMILLINLLKNSLPINKQVLEEKSNNEIRAKEEEIDLNLVTKQLKNANKKNINLTPYEEEQEEKAIISYEELIKSRNDLMLNYEDEQNEDGVIVKKVNMDNMTTLIDKNSLEDATIENPVRVISYEKEEEFLNSLKKLQELLNS